MKCCVLGCNRDAEYRNSARQLFCNKHKDDFEKYHKRGERQDIKGEFTKIEMEANNHK